MNTHFLNKRLSHLLGYAGLIPFVALAAACWLVDPSWLGDFIKGQLAYGVIILSFLGGLHWGATMLSGTLSIEQTRRALLWGVTPSLIAWLATMTGGFGYAVLMAGFIAAYQVDKRTYPWYRLPDWLIDLRFRLTCVVVPSLALAVMAANVRG
ncbi:DUF3429 domain-containing protein [Noviherbaspirillum galbum]|uniref:DUF3429 domain-containing protein n=1 Tax=Noviherbaspirillum galbum TaxID=2709383 RepID=A0A6B3SKA9_9BURK|nr:DUF3429 domain-containing protein [Noviherbaspirillum galbum]NEX61241.1 DUF3429 domain-containing protein [Noviherbaspirillum galbum]